MSDPPLPPSDDDAPDDPTWGTPGDGPQEADGAEPSPAKGARDEGRLDDDISRYDELIGFGGEAAENGESVDEPGAENVPARGGVEPTEVMPTIDPIGSGLTALEADAAHAANAAADSSAGLSVTQQIRRRRVSHRRYLIRRAVAGLLAAAVVAAAIVGAILLFGDDDDGTTAEGSVPVAGSSAPSSSAPADESVPAVVPATTAGPRRTTTTGAPADSVAASPDTTAVPGDTEGAVAPTTRPRRTTTTDPAAGARGSTPSEPPATTDSGGLYDLDKTPDCQMRGSARLGNSGSDVRCLEERLEEVTVGGVDFEVDSIFDEETEAAVRRFQQANDLIVDGVAGRETGSLLRIWPGSNDD